MGIDYFKGDIFERLTFVVGGIQAVKDWKGRINLFIYKSVDSCCCSRKSDDFGPG